jgi:hypothetical protein
VHAHLAAVELIFRANGGWGGARRDAATELEGRGVGGNGDDEREEEGWKEGKRVHLNY